MPALGKGNMALKRMDNVLIVVDVIPSGQERFYVPV
jgi:hypothetical protein